jgi:OOP family OmpA-OmpF porin
MPFSRGFWLSSKWEVHMRRALVRYSLASGVFVVSLILARDALAQAAPSGVTPGNGDGFDTHLFRPAFDSKGLFTINGADVLGHGDPSFGLVLDYGRSLLRVAETPNAPGALLEHSFQGTLHFDYGLFHRLVVGVQLPLLLMTGDQRAVAVPGWTTTKVDAQTLGFFALHAKLRLLRVEDDVGLAVGLQAGIPVSDAPKNGGADPSAWVWPSIILEKRFAQGKLRLAANAGFRGHAASTTTLPLRDGTFSDASRITYGAGASTSSARRTRRISSEAAARSGRPTKPWAASRCSSSRART